MIKNTLRGIATAEPPSGLIIRDIAVHQENASRWASLPERPMLDSEGRQIKNHAGRLQYASLICWRDRDLADRFSAALVALISVRHPDAFDR